MRKGQKLDMSGAMTFRLDKNADGGQTDDDGHISELKGWGQRSGQKTYSITTLAIEFSIRAKILAIPAIAGSMQGNSVVFRVYEPTR